MKKFMMLHYGFEQPTPEIMQKWNAWFAAMAERTVEHGGLADGVEISDAGSEPLPFGAGSITGYSIIEAQSLEEAEQLAGDNPFVDSIRVYEIRAQ